jgi:hypothetical protein
VIDFRLHARLSVRVDAAQRRIEVFANRHDFVPSCVAFETHVAHGHRVAEHHDAEFPQQALRDRARRHSRRRFTAEARSST